jgi:fumarate hydratase subunit alpha
MKTISAQRISALVARLCIQANYRLPKEVLRALRKARREETSSAGKEVLDQLLENARIAERGVYPLCQDTGMVEVFVEVGEKIRTDNLEEAIQRGVRRGYKEGYLRKSIVRVLSRENTNDNTPAIIHTKIVKKNRIKLTVFIKGFGSENVSAAKMLLPSQGKEGVVEFVLEKVRAADANPCPPVVIGVGIGGTLEKSSLLAKEAFIRPLGKSHPQKEISTLEKMLLKKINRLGIGPGGLGGKVTCLGVHIETFPTHIAGLPVAVNINCHALRYAQEILQL